MAWTVCDVRPSVRPYFHTFGKNNLTPLEICSNKLPLKTENNLQLRNSTEGHEAAIPVC